MAPFIFGVIFYYYTVKNNIQDIVFGNIRKSSLISAVLRFNNYLPGYFPDKPYHFEAVSQHKGRDASKPELLLLQLSVSGG